MRPGGCFGGPKAQGGAFLPFGCADRAGEGPLQERDGWNPTSALTSCPANGPAPEPRILHGQKRERGFQRPFPKVMGPSLQLCPQGECQDPARQVGGWSRTQGRKLQSGAGGNRTEITSPVQWPAEAGFPGRSSHPQGHLRLVGWCSAQQAGKTDLSTCPPQLPQGDQIKGAETARFSEHGDEPQCQSHHSGQATLAFHLTASSYRRPQGLGLAMRGAWGPRTDRSWSVGWPPQPGCGEGSVEWGGAGAGKGNLGLGLNPSSAASLGVLMYHGEPQFPHL